METPIESPLSPFRAHVVSLLRPVPHQEDKYSHFTIDWQIFVHQGPCPWIWRPFICTDAIWRTKKQGSGQADCRALVLWCLSVFRDWLFIGWIALQRDLIACQVLNQALRTLMHGHDWRIRNHPSAW